MPLATDDEASEDDVPCSVETTTQEAAEGERIMMMHFRPLHSLPVGRDVIVRLKRAVVHLGIRQQELYSSFHPPAVTCFAAVRLEPVTVTAFFHGPGMTDGKARCETVKMMHRLCSAASVSRSSPLYEPCPCKSSSY